MKTNSIAVVPVHRHGFNGNPPEFREKRFSAVKDSAGRILREAEASPQNVASDRLEWYLAHGKISPHHHQAGNRLFGDAHLAEIACYSVIGAVGGHGGGTLLPDAKIDAMKRINSARAALSPLSWRTVELVIMSGPPGHTVEEAGTIMGFGRRNGMGLLIAALDQLAAHYGLTTRIANGGNGRAKGGRKITDVPRET